MSEQKENNQLVMGIYDMIELMYELTAKVNENSLSPKDYGTVTK